ncbi:MAG: AccI family restriction endonuclease [Armatimonadota bacterium]|nr:AccI family restriction endonuclease [Armatimonadota bacterium]
MLEAALSVPAEEIASLLLEMSLVPWAEYVLNPRRLRGSDFLMRWSQGRWSEQLVVQAVNDTARYFALPYGPSGTAPEGNIREFELYFERLEKAGLGKMKRPDLLILPAAGRDKVARLVRDLGGPEELPFTREDDPRMAELITRAVVAVECENSLWIAKQMPDYRADLTPQKRLHGKPGLKKTAVVPTVIVKGEDRRPLRKWQSTHGVPVHIWHIFYDMAFGISLEDAEQLIRSGKIEETRQVFQAPGGATTHKTIYKIYYHYAYPLGEVVEEPRLVAATITDKNGHILPYVRFQGGKLALSPQVLDVLGRLARGKLEQA